MERRRSKPSQRRNTLSPSRCLAGLLDVDGCCVPSPPASRCGTPVSTARVRATHDGMGEADADINDVEELLRYNLDEDTASEEGDKENLTLGSRIAAKGSAPANNTPSKRSRADSFSPGGCFDGADHAKPLFRTSSHDNVSPELLAAAEVAGGARGRCAARKARRCSYVLPPEAFQIMGDGHNGSESDLVDVDDGEEPGPCTLAETVRSGLQATSPTTQQLKQQQGHAQIGLELPQLGSASSCDVPGLVRILVALPESSPRARVAAAQIYISAGYPVSPVAFADAAMLAEAALSGAPVTWEAAEAALAARPCVQRRGPPTSREEMRETLMRLRPVLEAMEADSKRQAEVITAATGIQSSRCGPEGYSYTDAATGEPCSPLLYEELYREFLAVTEGEKVFFTTDHTAAAEEAAAAEGVDDSTKIAEGSGAAGPAESGSCLTETSVSGGEFAVVAEEEAAAARGQEAVEADVHDGGFPTAAADTPPPPVSPMASPLQPPPPANASSPSPPPTITSPRESLGGRGHYRTPPAAAGAARSHSPCQALVSASPLEAEGRLGAAAADLGLHAEAATAAAAEDLAALKLAALGAAEKRLMEVWDAALAVYHNDVHRIEADFAAMALQPTRAHRSEGLADAAAFAAE